MDMHYVLVSVLCSIISSIVISMLVYAWKISIKKLSDIQNFEKNSISNAENLIYPNVLTGASAFSILTTIFQVQLVSIKGVLQSIAMAILICDAAFIIFCQIITLPRVFYYVIMSVICCGNIIYGLFLLWSSLLIAKIEGAYSLKIVDSIIKLQEDKKVGEL